MRQSRQAFTLIELLVVIAIIAILAAILFPVFAQAKAAAKQSTCLSDTKQQNLAIVSYETDSDDLFPIGEPHFNGYWNLGYTGWQWPCSAGEQDGDCVEWGNSVMPYIKNQGIFSCPTATKSNPFNYNSNTPDDTYTFNGTLQSSSETSVSSPALVVLLWSGTLSNSMLGRTWANPLLRCDDNNGSCVYTPNSDGDYHGNGSIDWVRLEPAEPNMSTWLHGHGDNFGYVDGHSKWHPLSGGVQWDPWSKSNPTTGVTDGSYWQVNGHTCLFSPDNPCGLGN